MYRDVVWVPNLWISKELRSCHYVSSLTLMTCANIWHKFDSSTCKLSNDLPMQKLPFVGVFVSCFFALSEM